MVSYNTIYHGEKVIAPVSAFNNFILELGNELSEIFDYDMYGTNSVIFDNKGFILFTKVRFMMNDEIDDMQYQFIVPLTIDDNWIIEIIAHKFRDIEHILSRYLFIVNDVTKNYDEKVTYKYIESIINSSWKDKTFLIPFKNKIFSDTEHDETLINIYSKFSYVLNIADKSDKCSCSIMRVISSDLDENDSIENIRFLDKEVINSQIIYKRDLRKYLVNLMIYGEF